MGDDSATQPQVKSSVSPDRLVLYEAVTARRLANDGLIWQVLALALAAQAFLMTIGLAPGTGRLARTTVGLLSAVVSVMAVQLMWRLRLFEKADSRWLAKFEEDAGWETIHAHIDVRLGPAKGWRRAGRLSAIWVWSGGLAVFGVVGLVIAGRAMFG
jgi:hypothetical protein